MSKGIISNRGGIQVVAGGATVLQGEVTGQTGVTITFVQTYTFGASGVLFYRNGVLMDKVGAFSGGSGNAEEYQEINNGSLSTQITLNATDPATSDELFQLVFMEGTNTVTLPSTYVMNIEIAGDFSSLASTTGYKIQTISTVSGDIFGSVAGSQLSISAGEYEIDMPFGYRGDCDQCYGGLYDVTNSIYIFDKIIAHCPGGAEVNSGAIKYRFSLPSPINMEFHSKVANPAGITEYLYGGTISKLN